MTKFPAALLAASLLGCASNPPVTIEVPVAVPVSCRIPEPQCAAPAYDAAKTTDSLDRKVRLMRAEIIQQEECVRLYREALAACRTE